MEPAKSKWLKHTHTPNRDDFADELDVFNQVLSNIILISELENLFSLRMTSPFFGFERI